MDPRSDTRRLCRAGARRLLRDHKAAAIFGCWTSASRKQVLPVLAEHNGLLFYPSQYEGEEQSPHVIYTGATPQQQALPAVDHLLRSRPPALLPGRHRLRLSAHHQRHHPQLSRRAAASARTRSTKSTRRSARRTGSDTVHRIRKFAGRDGAIIATLSGDANVHFFRERARQGLDADILPVMSLSLGEAEMPALAERNLVGHMVAWSYLHTLDTPENHAFIEEWREFTGDPAAITNDPMEASWIGFQLWAQSVAAAGTTDVEAVRARSPAASSARRRASTCGSMPENQHLHKPSVIGRMDEKNFIWPVWISKVLIAPEPWSQ